MRSLLREPLFRGVKKSPVLIPERELDLDFLRTKQINCVPLEMREGYDRMHARGQRIGASFCGK